MFFSYALSCLFPIDVYAQLVIKEWDGSEFKTSGGMPIDTGEAQDASASVSVTASNGDVYTVFKHRDSTNSNRNHIYLTLYDFSEDKVTIWDNDTTAFVSTFSDGDPIDLITVGGTARAVSEFKAAIDSSNRVYVCFTQGNGTNTQLYLMRYNGTTIEVWDTGATDWTTTMTDGSPIDTGSAQDVSDPEIVVDGSDNVYVSFYQSDGTYDSLYLVQYDGTDVGIWDDGAPNAFTTTFANGDAIDSSSDRAVTDIVMVAASDGDIYMAIKQTINTLGTPPGVFVVRYEAGGGDVEIWDHDDPSTFTATYADADEIDPSFGTTIKSLSIAIDSDDDIYIAYGAEIALGAAAVFVNRVRGGQVRIWDEDTFDFITTRANGDDISTGDTGDSIDGIALAVDSNDDLWIPHIVSNNTRLVFYDQDANAGTGRMNAWVESSSSFSTTLTDATVITPDAGNATAVQVIALDRYVYFPIIESDGTNARAHLVRWSQTASDIEIYQNFDVGFTSTLSSGGDFDVNSGQDVSEINVAGFNRAGSVIDMVWISYTQSDGTANHIYGHRMDAVFPTIGTISPDQGTDIGGTPVTITGTGFIDATTVTVGGVALTNKTLVSITEITGTTAAMPHGAQNVIVQNSDGRSGTLIQGFFAVGSPVVTGISPRNGKHEDNTFVEIIGRNFNNGAIVRFYNPDFNQRLTNYTVNSRTRITGLAPKGSPGMVVSVVVINPDSRQGSLSNAFEYDVTPQRSRSRESTNVCFIGHVQDHLYGIQIRIVSAVLVLVILSFIAYYISVRKRSR